MLHIWKSLSMLILVILPWLMILDSFFTQDNNLRCGPTGPWNKTDTLYLGYYITSIAVTIQELLSLPHFCSGFVLLFWLASLPELSSYLYVITFSVYLWNPRYMLLFWLPKRRNTQTRMEWSLSFTLCYSSKADEQRHYLTARVRKLLKSVFRSGIFVGIVFQNVDST